MAYYFSCPSCQSNESFSKPRGATSGSEGAALVFGGLLAWAALKAENMERIQCDACGYLFRQPSVPPTRLASFARVVLILTLGSMVLGFLAVCALDLLEPPFGFSWLITAEKFVIDHPRFVVLTIVPLFGILVPLCLLTSFFSNARHRRNLAKSIKTKVPVRGFNPEPELETSKN